MSELLTTELIKAIVKLVPESWLEEETFFSTIEEHRAAYITYLTERLRSRRVFVDEAIDARTQLI